MNQAQAAQSLADAQRQARGQLFVGRKRELAAFEACLASLETPRIIHIHGSGGIGKSSLLYRFKALTEQAGCGFARLDARLLPAAPDVVRQGVDQALAKLDTGDDSPRVLALDHAEQWAVLDSWLRTTLLPTLPGNLILVVASRQAPRPEWRVDPGISQFLSVYELLPLTREEATGYLQRRSIACPQRQPIVDFARGNPLALALASDHLLRTPDQVFDSSNAPELFDALVGWLLRDLDDSQQQRAVAACATVRSLDEPLLAAMLGQDHASATFDWLAYQHFVERQTNGLVIHDLVRELVIHDLRSRDLGQHHTLIRGAADRYIAGLDNAPPAQASQLMGDLLYATRHEPYLQQMFPFGDMAYYVDHAAESEWQSLADEVARLEGAESRTWFEYWVGRDRTELLVVRDRSGTPAGLALLLHFTAADIAPEHDDPAVHNWFRALRNHMPIRGGELATLSRHQMAHGTHQAGTAPYAYLTAHLNGLFFLPRLVVAGFPADLAYDWSPVARHAGGHFFPETDYQMGERRFQPCCIDMRPEPPPEWADKTMQRILFGNDGSKARPTPVALLERTSFGEAVSQALRDFNDNSALANNALLQSPMLRRYARHHNVDTLRSLIRETSADTLGASQIPGNTHEILELVYFEPTAKLQAAASELNISERTLRRRIRQAEERLAEALWRLDTQMD